VTIPFSYVSILAPDGSTLVSPVAVFTNGKFIDPATLPTTGTYTILVDPYSTYTGTMTLTLYDVPADPSGTIAAGGASIGVTTVTPGQNARSTFSGSAGQRVSLDVKSVSLSPSGSYEYVSILKPDGSTLASTTVFPSSGWIDAQTLPSSGTYTVLVDPNGVATGSATLTLYDVPQDVGGSITPSAGGGASSPATTVPGQNAALTFAGTQGERVSLKINGVSLSDPSLYETVSIKKPDGSILAGSGAVVSSGWIDTQSLPASGNYTVFVDPYKNATSNTTLALYDVPPDATDSSSVDTGVPSTLATTVPGQDSKLTFQGSAGQQVYVMRTDVTTPTSTVKILAPDGSVVTSSGLISSADGDLGAVLPADGTYTVSIDGWQDAIGRMSLDVSSEEEMPGVYSDDQSADTGSDEVPTTPVAPQPMSPLGVVDPSMYSTELWDAESTEVQNGLQVITSTAPGTAAVTGVALNDAAARQPLAYATVTLMDAVGTQTTTSTDSQGGFAFINMPAGVYSLTISAPPLGTYRLINDTYEAGGTSELTALVSTEAQTYDASQTAEDSDAATPQTPKKYPSFSRIPPTINVADVKPGSHCVATISDSAASVRTYDWKYYLLHVAENEVANQHYNEDAFKAFALTASNYAWYYKIYPRSYLPAGADTDNSTHFQCMRPGRISNHRWVGWINEALRYRVVTPATKPAGIYDTEYLQGSQGSCTSPHAGVSSTQLTQIGLKYYSEHCSYGDWKDLLGVYYPNSDVRLVDVPVRPTTSATSFDGGVSLTFQSQVRNPNSLLPYSDAWGFIVSRKIGNGQWRSFFVSRWDETTRSIKSSVVVNTSGCARYRVAAWNPRWWNTADPRKSAWSKVRGGALVGPTGVTCS
jgi:Carboxypeptidase regulatory-like domain